MDQTPIQLAIERVYNVFAVYPCPVKLDASWAKDPVATIRKLTSAPLRDLEADQLGTFAGAALYTMGGVAEYKHFLPRILELATSGFSGWMGFDPSIIALHLVYGRWREWSVVEVETIIAVFRDGWIDARDRNPDSECDAPDWLCGLAILEEPISDLLADWLLAPTVNAVLQAASFVSLAQSWLFGPREDGAYWSHVDDARRLEVASWMRSDTVFEALALARELVADDDLRSVDRALTILREMRD